MSITLLALDTSTEACSVALLKNGEVTFKYQLAQREHAQHILQLVDTLLSESECRLSDVDAIAYGKGPGSFTGVRIGVGVAQGLGFGIERPLIGVSSLVTLAQGAYRLHHAKKIISAIDARMKEVYLGAFSFQSEGVWVESVESTVIPPEKVEYYLKQSVKFDENWKGVGTGWPAYRESLPYVEEIGPNLPSSQDMIIIAKALYEAKKWESPEAAEPYYLRNEVTWNKLPGRT